MVRTEKIPAGYQRLRGSQRTTAAGARRVGPSDPNEEFTVSVRVRRRPGSRPLPSLEDWTANPRGPRRMSREEFAREYGATEADLESVEKFARTNGLKVVEQSQARRTVVLSGKARQISGAFGVELGRYESEKTKETYRGREGYIYVPNELADVVEGVFGLDNRRVARRMLAGPLTDSPLTPFDVASLYQFPVLPVPPNGVGETIGIFEFGGGFEMDDITSFFSFFGRATPQIVVVPVDGRDNEPGGDVDEDSESVIDITTAGAVAPNSRIAVYFGPFTEQGWMDTTTTAIFGENLPEGWAAPSVLSISWGSQENSGDWTDMGRLGVSGAFQEAALLGVTTMVATGDDGSNCFVGDGGAYVNYPASDPWVTAVGGTSIQVNDFGPFTEGIWNDGDGAVTGGGISDVFPLPPWQAGAGIPPSLNDGHFGRGIPDIAGYAAGYELNVEGQNLGSVPGTSEAAPLYAGMIALLNQMLGTPVGYLNPFLYQMAGPGVISDINDGRNNSSEGSKGYTCGPGWDGCTGLGSLRGAPLLNALEIYLFTMLLPALD